MTLLNSADFYHEQVVPQLSMSYEELQYDIVKEALENSGGQSKKNKDHLKIKRLDDLIFVQDELILKLQKEVIDLRKLVKDKRRSQPSYKMASLQ